MLRCQGIRLSFFKTFTYRTIGHSLGYLTPFARVGGEPLRALLVSRSMKCKKSDVFSSILLEGSIGFSVDIFLMFVAILYLAMVSSIEQVFVLLCISVALMLLVFFYIYALAANKGFFSSFLIIARKAVPARRIDRLIKSTKSVEYEMSKFLTSDKKDVLKVVLLSVFTWPLMLLQYKFALHSLGIEDVSLPLITLSLIATAISPFSPVPGSFGTQETSYFLIFGFANMATAGIALSLLVRSKDVFLAALGIIFLSKEGVGFFEVMEKIRKKKKH